MSFSCGESPKQLCSVLAPRPTTSCVACYPLVFILVSSSSEAGLTPVMQAHWLEEDWPLWAEPEHSILPQPRPAGPVNLILTLGIPCGWGPWRTSASCHSWGGPAEERRTPVPLFVLSQHSKAPAASCLQGCLRYFSLNSSLQTQQMTGMAWAKPGSETLRTAPHSS